MKFLVCLSIIALLAVTQAVILVPEDAAIENQPGQCPSGYPIDGLFSSCEININSSWRIGALSGERDLTRVDSSQISFPSDFGVVPPGLDFQQNNDNSSSSCSIRIPGSSVLYQPMFNLKFAHYKLHGCAKAFGSSRCRVVIRDVYNRIVDWIDFRDDSQLQCRNDSNVCQSSCSDGWNSATVKYQGVGDVIVRRLGETDEANWLRFNNLRRGDPINLQASDFPLPNNNNNTDNSTNNSDNSNFLPSQLEFVSGSNRDQIDVLLTDCSEGGLFPGQFFGDNNQYLLSSVEADQQQSLCAVSDVLGVKQCQCEDQDRNAVCAESSKGFVALPDQVYYLGLVTEECSCAFDSVCLSQVGGVSGFFGPEWLDTRDIRDQQS